MAFADAIRAADMVALDIETTGLNPRHDQISVVALAVPGHAPALYDALEKPIERLFPRLKGKTLLMHNGLFDLSFLMAKGFTPHRVIDTTFLVDPTAASHKWSRLRMSKRFWLISQKEQRRLGRVHTKEQIDYAPERPRPSQNLPGVAEWQAVSLIADIEMRFLRRL